MPDQSPNTAVNLNHEKGSKHVLLQRFCGFKMLKIQIIGQAAQSFSTLGIRDHL